MLVVARYLQFHVKIELDQVQNLEGLSLSFKRTVGFLPYDIEGLIVNA